MKEVLRELNLGNSVAEFDQALEKYFVENEAFYALTKDGADIVAGDKGTGKTALFRILRDRFGQLEELSGARMLAAFNPEGDPVFTKLTREKPLSEQMYISFWKTYFLSLAGNWIVNYFGDEPTERVRELEDLLQRVGLRARDPKPEGVLRLILGFFWGKPKSAELAITATEHGIPVVHTKMTFADSQEPSAKKIADPEEMEHSESLSLLNQAIESADIKLWIVMDRLDEAFQGNPEVEIPALRGLFRTYLDLQAFKSLRLKLFVRRDLFRRITAGTFVNLTHINARKIEISWDEADLLNLLCRRVRDNQRVMDSLEARDLTDEQLFYLLFPKKVEPAERKPLTWRWIVSRIRDGNDVKPPRNLIDLTVFAKNEQLKSESRTPRAFSKEGPLIEAESLKRALKILSETRVSDTMIAEAPPAMQALLQRFRRAKSEHNLESLGAVLAAC